MNDKIKLRKLITIKKNCIVEKKMILRSNFSEFLKFLIDTKVIIKEITSPKTKE